MNASELHVLMIWRRNVCGPLRWDLVLDFNIGYHCTKMRTPMDHTFTSIDQSCVIPVFECWFSSDLSCGERTCEWYFYDEVKSLKFSRFALEHYVQPHKRLRDRLASLVQCEKSTCPIQGRTQRFDLFLDVTSVWVCPIPYVFQKFLSGHVLSCHVQRFLQLSLHHRLSRDTRMIESRNPRHVLSFHFLKSHETVLNRKCQCMSHMKSSVTLGGGRIIEYEDVVDLPKRSVFPIFHIVQIPPSTDLRTCKRTLVSSKNSLRIPIQRIIFYLSNRVRYTCLRSSISS